MKPMPRKPATGTASRHRRASVRRLRGASLIELVIAITIISVALSGSMLLIDATSRHSADPMITNQALAIAEAYLEEILLQAYIDPDLDPISGAVCPPAEASRPLYDNVCDYHGLSDIGATDQEGNAIAGLAAYTIAVTVSTSATLNDLSGSAQVLRVDVSVDHISSDDIALSGYRSKS